MLTIVNMNDLEPGEPHAPFDGRRAAESALAAFEADPMRRESVIWTTYADACPEVWCIVDRVVRATLPNCYSISGGGPSLLIVAMSTKDALRYLADHLARTGTHDDDVLRWAWFEIELASGNEAVESDGQKRPVCDFPAGFVFSEEF